MQTPGKHTKDKKETDDRTDLKTRTPSGNILQNTVSSLRSIFSPQKIKVVNEKSTSASASAIKVNLAFANLHDQTGEARRSVKATLDCIHESDYHLCMIKANQLII